MTDKLPVNDIVSAVRSAAHDVFSLMLNLPLEDRPSYEKTEKDPPENAEGVEALVGIAGTWSGTGRICSNSRFACQVASAMLMTLDLYRKRPGGQARKSGTRLGPGRFG